MPLRLPPINPVGPLFKELNAEQTGISFVNRYPLDSQIKFNMMEGAFGVGGVCIGDYDGDGRADIYFSSAPRDANSP